MSRQVKAGNYITSGDSKTYTLAENQKRKNLYRKAIGRCCKPNCPMGLDLHVHHIDLVSHSGSDDFTNYIILCKYCHQHSRLHRLSEEHRMEYLVYKFYIEKLVLGFCSDEMSNEEFELKLQRITGGTAQNSENKAVSLAGQS